VRLLLDTHAALWWLDDAAPLGERALTLLADGRSEVLLSAVVVWEVAIKRALGKLEAPDGFASTLLGAGARALPIALEHAAAVERLPAIHPDPFDRLLVAQAQREGATILTKDAVLARYGVDVAW
jgi:PIN domain nuclease of toxin-antitoxin system